MIYIVIYDIHCNIYILDIEIYMIYDFNIISWWCTFCINTMSFVCQERDGSAILCHNLCSSLYISGFSTDIYERRTFNFWMGFLIRIQLITKIIITWMSLVWTINWQRKIIVNVNVNVRQTEYIFYYETLLVIHSSTIPLQNKYLFLFLY